MSDNRWHIKKLRSMKLFVNFVLFFGVITSLILEHKAEIAFYTAAQLRESLKMRSAIVAEEIARLQAIVPVIDTNEELIKQLYALHWKLQSDIRNIDSYTDGSSQPKEENVTPLARGSTSRIFAATDDEAKTFSRWSSFFNFRRRNSNQPVRDQQNTAGFPYAIESTALGNYASMPQQEANVGAPFILSPQQLSSLQNAGDINYFYAAPTSPLKSENSNARPSVLNRIASFFRQPTDQNVNQLQANNPPPPPTPALIGQVHGSAQNFESFSNFNGATDVTVINADELLHRLIRQRNNLDHYIKKLQADRNE